MSQTITKTDLEAQVAELQAQLAEAQQPAPVNADGQPAQLRIKVRLPDSMEATSNGFPLVRPYTHDGVPHLSCTCPFMVGSAFGKPFNKIEFQDHDAIRIEDLIRQGYLEVEIEANFRTRIWQKSPTETSISDKWVVTSFTPVNAPEELSSAPTGDTEVSASTIETEEIPF